MRHRKDMVKSTDEERKVAYLRFEELKNEEKLDFDKLYIAIQDSSALSFHELGLLLMDITHEYEGSNYKELFHYYTTHWDMNPSQLWSYFSWRTKVRRRIVENIDYSYVFLYVCELLHQIHPSDDKYEILDSLLYLGESFEKIDEWFTVNNLCKHLTIWIPDYIHYYCLDESKIQNPFYDYMFPEGANTYIDKKDITVFQKATGSKDVQATQKILTRIGYNYTRGAFKREYSQEMAIDITNYILAKVFEDRPDMINLMIEIDEGRSYYFHRAVFDVPIPSLPVYRLNKGFIDEYTREVEKRLDALFGVTQTIFDKEYKYLTKEMSGFIESAILEFSRDKPIRRRKI